jgi:predicted solute-binding protein
MTLLLHDSLMSSHLVFPFTAGWVQTEITWEARESLTVAEVDTGTSALIPSAEIASLTETHAVVPDVAVITEGRGLVAMRVPVRPDEIEGGTVRLFDTSSTAEILARATLESFYGIAARVYSREASDDAQVVIVEGAEALRTPEGGFSEDLVRAWFILTAQPVVSHLLVVPKDADPSDARSAMLDAKQVGHERRRDVRKAMAERHEIDREVLTEVFGGFRYALDDPDRRALMMLLQRGNKGSAFPYPWELTYAEPPAE